MNGFDEQYDLDSFINQVLNEQNMNENENQDNVNAQRQNFVKLSDMAQPYFDNILPLQNQKQPTNMPTGSMPNTLNNFSSYSNETSGGQYDQSFQNQNFFQNQNPDLITSQFQPNIPQNFNYNQFNQSAQENPEQAQRDSVGQNKTNGNGLSQRRGSRGANTRSLNKKDSQDSQGTNSTNEDQARQDKFVFSSMTGQEQGEDFIEGEEEPPNKQAKLNKQEAMLEKNRKAQRKFREKQKEKMHTLEQQVNQLREELKNLSVENTDLQSQRTLLQQALRFKDCLVQSLREQEGTQFKETKIMEVYGVDKLDKNDMVDSFGKPITIERLKLLQQVEINEIYKKWIKVFRDLLEAKSLSQKKGQQYSSLLKEIQNMGAFLSKLSIHNYSGIVRLLMYNVETMELINKTEEVSQQEVKDYLAILSLSSKQQEDLHSLYWKMHERKRDKVQLLQSVTAQVNQEFQQLRQMHPINYIRQQVSFKALKFHDAANRFKALVEDVHLLHTEFYGMILYQIFEPLQTAKILVKAYPEFPNLSALVHFVYNAIEQDQSGKKKVQK